MPARLRDGATVHLRPLAPGEVDVVEQVFTGMSARSRQQRYLVPMPRLPGGARRSLAATDSDRHVAWVALLDGRPVGLCRFVRTAHDRAEVAFEVVDAQQGRGIASTLVDAVAAVADAVGVRWLEASVAHGNHASVAVLAGLGLELRPDDGLLVGTGLLRLPAVPRVDRVAVLELAGQLVAGPTSRSTAAATSSS
ncbi:GNAT family N-acetyltransferase [Nocardioides pinisoli]|uniref:GNAT family N-acetyltransferase n=1 Tax=Nocardioides pinisoli TaxID=2950279 RepID=A0ABT1KY18_9ACTN|nr:GNAT family N-acetyltransferase [Nocardioides pinisoli]MCP3422279.1 GNAT family N-acetyltransferase [Nocardioides pinisoli]